MAHDTIKKFYAGYYLKTTLGLLLPRTTMDHKILTASSVLEFEFCQTEMKSC